MEEMRRGKFGGKRKMSDRKRWRKRESEMKMRKRREGEV